MNSQLIVRPGRNALREAKRIKEVRKVKGAIAWHEKERKKRQKIGQERFESKQAALQRLQWQRDNVEKVKEKALKNVAEDWDLGPLRPNRAVGAGADKYGAITQEQVQKPSIPIHTQRNRNMVREKKGLELEYPLVVDDQKYFPIVADDRVVVIRGREKGKIGVVQSIVKQTHEVLIKGVNMQYYDSNIFNTTGEEVGPKRESEVPMPLDDVRLVIPYKITSKNGKDTYRDVCVEKIFMERHTTGMDPFSGHDYGTAEIPEDHQYDPESGLPIFHRYIAGTDRTQRIEWPWERLEGLEDMGALKDAESERQSLMKRTWNTLRHPVKSTKRLLSSSKDDNGNPQEKDISSEIVAAQEAYRQRQAEGPQSERPYVAEPYDGVDTYRHVVEANQNQPAYSITLTEPPHPDTVRLELCGEMQRLANKNAKEERKALAEAAEPRMPRVRNNTAAMPQQMKTPMQLRWETEHAKKIRDRTENPLVTTDVLMAALGKHMKAAKDLKKQQRKTIKAEELD